MQRAFSHIARTDSEPSPTTSMDSGADFRIFLAGEEDGHVTYKCPFINNFKDFVPNRNMNYLRKKVVCVAVADIVATEVVVVVITATGPSELEERMKILRHLLTISPKEEQGVALNLRDKVISRLMR